MKRAMGEKFDWKPDFENFAKGSEAERRFVHRQQQRQDFSGEFEMGKKANMSNFEVGVLNHCCHSTKGFRC